MPSPQNSNSTAVSFIGKESAQTTATEELPSHGRLHDRRIAIRFQAEAIIFTPHHRNRLWDQVKPICSTSICFRGWNWPLTSSINTKTFLRSVRRLLVTASVVPSSQIFVTLMKEALSSSETSVLTRATWRNIPEDTILQLMWKSFANGSSVYVELALQMPSDENLDLTDATIFLCMPVFCWRRRVASSLHYLPIRMSSSRFMYLFI
jgi:hypothetical protein